MTDEEIREREDDEVRSAFCSAVGHTQTSRRHLAAGKTAEYRVSRKHATAQVGQLMALSGLPEADVRGRVERVADTEDREIRTLLDALRAREADA